jgi:hypothetical protein
MNERARIRFFYELIGEMLQISRAGAQVLEPLLYAYKRTENSPACYTSHSE